MVPNSFYEHIGATIKARRRVLGMKQKNLAAKLGISRGSLANIEIGRQCLLVHQLYRFASVLELQPQDLLPPLPIDFSASSELDDLMPAGLKPAQKQQLARLIEGTRVEAPSEREGDNARTSKK